MAVGASNTIELITKYSTKAWDKVYKAEAVSSLLDAPSAQVQFTGAKTVKISKFQATGLGNYYRPNTEVGNAASYGENYNVGYASGNVGLVWEEFTLSQDRGASYPVELFDNEETDGLTLGAATTEISRTIIIPEVDAYCFSKIASYCTTNLGNLADSAIDKTNSLEKLNDGLLYFDNNEVPAENQIIFVSPTYMNNLRNNTTELSRYLMQGDYDKDVKFRLTTYEGRKLAVVPPQRFRTGIDLTGKGIKWNADSRQIQFMIVAKDAVLHVVKYNKVKIIGGDMNLAGQNFDGYTIFARVYHDVFVPDNKRLAIYTHLAANTNVTVANSLDVLFENEGNRRVTSVTVKPAEAVSKVYKSAQTLEVGAAFTKAAGDTIVKAGVELGTAATTLYAVVDGKVIAKQTVAAATATADSE